MKLREALRQLGEFPDDQTIYIEAGSGWGATSEVVVAEESDDGGPPEGFDYFLEVHLAREVLRVWQEWRGGREPTPDELCDAVIYYARNDAYQPT